MLVDILYDSWVIGIVGGCFASMMASYLWDRHKKRHFPAKTHFHHGFGPSYIYPERIREVVGILKAAEIDVVTGRRDLETAFSRLNPEVKRYIDDNHLNKFSYSVVCAKNFRFTRFFTQWTCNYWRRTRSQGNSQLIIQLYDYYIGKRKKHLFVITILEASMNGVMASDDRLVPYSYGSYSPASNLE